MSVTVLTSIMGGYDSLTPVLPQTVDARWVCVTDNPHLASEGWEVILESRPHMHPRLAAKVAKCLPRTYTDSSTVVWIDGSCKFLTEHTLSDILREAEGTTLAQIPHPWRSCIYTEAEESAKLLKYQGQPVIEQVAEYQRKAQHPSDWGLWATGMIVRNYEHPNAWFLDNLGEQWLLEQVRWTYQDQLSEAPILRVMGQRPSSLPFALHGSGLFEWHGHASEA